MPHYITRQELSRLVRHAQASGDITCMVPVLLHLADGYVARKVPSLDHEEVAQQFCLLVHRHIQKLDPNANCFNYLTKICNRVCLDLREKEARYAAKMAGYAATYVGPDRRRGRLGEPMP